MTDLFREIAFPYHPNMRERFIADDSTLLTEWAARYHDRLFDDRDIEIAKHQAPRAKGGYHFFEWLAAVLIFESTGYLSLVETYQGKEHKRKQGILARLLPEKVAALVNDSRPYGNVQGPDLLVYSPDYTKYYFCEVKNPRDRLRPKPKAYFEALAATCSSPILIARFVALDRYECRGSSVST